MSFLPRLRRANGRGRGLFASLLSYLGNRSTATTDRITTGDTLTSPGGPWSCAMWYTPHHPSFVGAVGDISVVAEWANAAADGRLFLLWDNTGLGVDRAWFQRSAGNVYHSVRYPTAFVADTPYHLVGCWQDDRATGDSLDAYLDGVRVASTTCTAPTSGANTAICAWMDRYSLISPKGTLGYVAWWDGIGLCVQEAFALKNGVDPRDIRPTNAAALKFFQDFTTGAATDLSPVPISPITVTGTDYPTGTGPTRLPRAQTFGRTGTQYMVFHDANATIALGKYPKVMYAAECTDGTGINFVSRSCYQMPPNAAAPSNAFTDMDAYAVYNGVYWAAGINVQENGVSSTWDLYRSPDGVDWTFVQSVDCSAITGTGAGKRCWKPRFIIEGGKLGVFVSLAFSGDASASPPHLYYMETVTTDPTGAWTPPTILTGTLPTVNYDGQVIKEGSTYLLVYTHWISYPTLGEWVEVATATNITGPYTPIKTLDWGGWGGPDGVQGVCILRRADGRVVFYQDLNYEMDYSLSSESGATILDVITSGTNTWSARAPINLNGVAAAGANPFIVQGATIRNGELASDPCPDVVFDGDSRTTATYGLPYAVMSPLTSTYLNVAVSGTLSAAIADGRNTTTALNGSGSEVCVLWIGVNSLRTNVSGAAVFADIQDWAAAVRAAGRLAVVCTEIDCTDFFVGTDVTGYRAQRDILNGLIAANSSDFDGIADLAADPDLMDADDTTYFVDKIHLTTAGTAVVASIIRPVLASLGVS